MATYVSTITRQDTDTPWIVSQAPYAEAYCTTDELNNIIIPFRNYASSLPGYVDVTTSESNANLSLTITTTFDTKENATSAKNAVQNPSESNTISLARKNFITEKRTAANVAYSITTTVK